MLILGAGRMADPERETVFFRVGHRVCFCLMETSNVLFITSLVSFIAI
uniref:Uncharacterized protein n=1 Tax=Arundo donax TaxID=35708 RepID=A0A0A9AT36_ARUDO